MDLSATSRRRSLRLVSSSLRPVGIAGAAPEWRRVAAAVLASTRDHGRHLMKRMYLDADGRRCLLSLEQATHESELAVAQMTGRAG
jgi:hypothetical protein